MIISQKGYNCCGYALGNDLKSNNLIQYWFGIRLIKYAITRERTFYSHTIKFDRQCIRYDNFTTFDLPRKKHLLRPFVRRLYLVSDNLSWGYVENFGK